jgi:16S rRNA (cytidine1402-2'-O)-methyltransferase
LALYLIPTPISEEALDTLPAGVCDIARRLEVFVVERAKSARRFVKRLNPQRPLEEITFLEFDRSGRLTPEVAALFEQAVCQGRDVGLLSEAGCPAVADPGAALVALAHRLQVPVVPLVGPSSILLALMASGLNGQCFAFHGYLPAKRPELVRRLRQLEQQVWQYNQTQLFMETPYRTAWLFDIALNTLQSDTAFGIAQDLTGSNAFIHTQTVGEWKAGSVALAALPTIFLIGLPAG